MTIWDNRQLHNSICKFSKHYRLSLNVFGILGWTGTPPHEEILSPHKQSTLYLRHRETATVREDLILHVRSRSCSEVQADGEDSSWSVQDEPIGRQPKFAI